MIGFACDRFGAVKTCYAVLAVGILTVSGFALAPVNLPLFAVLAFFFGIVTSAVMVLSPILTLDFFGRENYEKFYARVSMGAPIASILLLPAYGFVYDMTGGYGPVFAAMAVLLAAAAVCICLGWRKR